MKLVRNLTFTSLLAFAIGWNAYGIYAVVPTVEQPAPVEVSFNEPQEPVIDINQMHCLATNIYHEARGESFAGKVAVANVTHNRVDINVLKSKLQETESKEFKKNLYILSTLILGLDILGVYLSL